MKQNYCNNQPSSFAETVQLVESYVRSEITLETRKKKLFYHTLNHALAVKRRAGCIFQAIKPTLAQNIPDQELKRLESLIDLAALAHDMVQIFDSDTPVEQPRKRLSGLSETETANKLLQYIQNLNQELSALNVKPTILFSDRDQQIIQDAIVATVCQPDPQAAIANYTFSTHSLYQPYLYQVQPKISIVGSIIALADLGTLGMDGIEKYIQDGILVFLEDNPNYEAMLMPENSSRCQSQNGVGLSDRNLLKSKLLTMARFIVSFAHDRKARFELEISGFPPPARQTLRENVFIYFNPENIEKLEAVVPTYNNVSLDDLINFFWIPKISIDY